MMLEWRSDEGQAEAGYGEIWEIEVGIHLCAENDLSSI
jgi:hypothetical protein